MTGHAYSPPRRRSKKSSTIILTLSYALDWIILIAIGLVGLVLDRVTPNKRPFQLEDPNISFPFTVHETVTSAVLLCCNAAAPVVIILIIALVFIPGNTVPTGTPKSLIWRRKLWELHTGWLGLALSLVSAWFITNGMKNLFGKPRPDLLSRCQPDIANVALYIVGGIANTTSNGQLVSADICTNTDKRLLDDGFRSYPSGHSSSSAAGLIYLSLFIASKFAITIPFLAPSGYGGEDSAISFSAFPSRLRGEDHGVYEMVEGVGTESTTGNGSGGPTGRRLAQHNRTVLSARRMAAAPPLYLLAICVIPWFAAIFIASSRWFDFRHHGFDILFGFLIGTVCAFFAFRYYHLPISQGAGWAWGPRSADKAFWGGVGSYSYATDKRSWRRGGDEDEEENIGLGAADMPPANKSRHGESSGLGLDGAASGTTAARR